MIPENELSSTPVVSGFLFPVKTLSLADRKQDWELGGVAINDPSQGLLVKLWKFTLEVDDESGFGSVYAQADDVAKTLLFDGYDITEISGCFDQNMRPFVAYVQDGQPKIYWYDTVALDMVHTSLPAGAFDLRCSLDEKRLFAIADSDVILSYVRGGSLFYCYQRDRYEIEYLLADDVTRLISMAVNKKSRMQWRAQGQNAAGYTDPYLGDILYDYCRQAGYEPEEIDVSEMYEPDMRVSGILVDEDQGLDAPIAALMEVFPFYRVDVGRCTSFRRMGRDVSARIPFNKLVDDFPKTLKRLEKDRAKLPKGVQLNHVDPNGGFAKNFQRAFRRTNIPIGSGVKTITTKVVMNADQAVNAAWRKLKQYHNELYDYEFSTRLEYTFLVPGDVIEVEDADGTWYRMRIKQRNEDEGTIAWECEQDGGYLVYNGVSPPGGELKPPVSTTPGVIGETELDIFNLPVNREADDELVLYVGARGGGAGWSGASLYASPDGVVPYADTGYSFDVPANIGETLTAVTDSDTSVEVLMPEPLESVSTGEIAAGRNRFIIGDEEVQVSTATLLGMVDGMYHYSLTGMTRGILHSTREAWSAGIRFAEFNDALVAVKVQRSYYGSELFFKGVSYGTSIDEASALSYDFTYAASQTEWPVTNVVVTAAEGGGITVTWDGSPRLGTFGPSPYHSKYMIGYQVKFADGHTIETTAETVTYPAGLMGTVVEVRARNEITGLGPLADGEGAVDPGETEGFLFTGSFSDGFVGEALQQWNGEGYTASGGYWDANAHGFMVPGVGAKNVDSATLVGTRMVGIPFQAGTFTSKVRVDASSPVPGGSGTEEISQTVVVHPRRTHGALDLRGKTYAYNAKLVVTDPPLSTFQIDGAASFHFYGVTAGKVCGQFRITGSTQPVLIGIDTKKGELSVASPTVSIGPFETATYAADDGTYSVELNADTGAFWIYKLVSGSPSLVHSGTLSLPGGNQYRVCLTSEYTQSFLMESYGGYSGSTWLMPVTQAGHGGVPVPNTPIPLAWASVQPDYAASVNGDGFSGAVYLDDIAVFQHVAKTNAAYSSGKHRWSMYGAQRSGICVAAFDETHGLLGAAGAPDSVGVGVSVITAGSFTVDWCFGGVHGTRELTLPSAYYPQVIFGLDCDNDTLKICAYDMTGTTVVVLDTISLPSGQTWIPAETRSNLNAVVIYNPPGPAGYDDAVVP